MKSVPTVADFMNHEVVTLDPNMDIYEAIDFLVLRRLSGSLVVSSEGQLVGILSEKDCLKVLAKGMAHSPASGPVEYFMTREVVSIPQAMDIYFAAGKFLGTPFRSFPVVEQALHQRLVGQITRRDILRGIQTINRVKKAMTHEKWVGSAS